jgi:hypothetical protein
VPVLGVMTCQARGIQFLSRLTGIESSRCQTIDQEYFLMRLNVFKSLKINIKIYIKAKWCTASPF